MSSSSSSFFVLTRFCYRQRRIDKEKAEAGPDPRRVELNLLNEQLLPMRLRIHEVQSDGHCLYRAVAVSLYAAEREFMAMRATAARHLRENKEEFLPFLDAEDVADFEGYCSRVESTSQWGGDLEVKALSEALTKPIQVYRAGNDPLLFGGNSNCGSTSTPLRISFHEAYYALGAHYNAIVNT